MRKRDLTSELANYVLALHKAAASTRRTEDRVLYEKYLADAAVLLALAETNATQDDIRKAVNTHERLWGNTWLQDEAYKGPAAAWQVVKGAFL